MNWPDERRGSDPKPIGESLEHVVKSFGGPSLAALEQIFGNWEHVVGKEVAQHARPVKLQAGQLLVEVSDGAWASQLRWMTAEVLEALAREVGPGVVTGLKVRVSPGPK